MQGTKQEQDGLFFYGSLDSLVPADDRYRRLGALLDLSWVRRETARLYGWTGRPSVDPVVIAKLLIIAFFEDIASERELVRQAHLNLAYRRFLGYRLDEALPDHSSLSRARYRLGLRFFIRLFEYALGLCLDAGLVGGDQQSVDSTFVEANASLASLRSRTLSQTAEAFTRRFFQSNPAQEEPAAEEDPPPRRRRARRNDAVVSRTDPDCGLDRRRGTKGRLGYRVTYAVDRLKGVITGVRASPAHDGDAAQLVPLIDEVRQRGIPVQSVAADKGYSAGAVYQALEERGIEAFIPLQQRGAERQGRYGQDRFTYDEAEDRYRCPGGAWLPFRRADRGDRIYQAATRDCRGCELRATCTTARSRKLTVSRYHEPLERARQRSRTAAAGRAAVVRRIRSERTFGEGKEEHGLTRARWRGRVNMDKQALMTAMVQNLRRYLQAQTRVLEGAAALGAPSGVLSKAVTRMRRAVAARLGRSGGQRGVWGPPEVREQFGVLAPP